MSLKAFFAIAVVLAIAAGFALPGPNRAEAEPQSQFSTLDLDD